MIHLSRGQSLVLAGVVAMPLAAWADPPPDQAAIVTIQGENASITTARLSDRYYVNGLRLSYVSPTGDVPSFLSSLGNAIGGGSQRYVADIEQSIFTPANTTVKPPPPTDRPYAGLLTGTLALIQDTDSTRTMLGLQLGVVGPAAGADEVQNGFHNIIGQGRTVGFNYQIHDEPLGELIGSHTWRMPLVQVAGLETDVLPNVTVGLGNERDYALAGGTVRLGQGLVSDFGVSRVAPGLSGGDAFTPSQPLSYYVFLGGDGQAVGHDITLDGNTGRDSARVDRKILVGEIQGGLALIYRGVRLTYTQVAQTAEFHKQRDGLHQFGSLALSIRF